MKERNDLLEAFNQKYHGIAQEIELLFQTLKSSALSEQEKETTYLLLLKMRALQLDCLNTKDRQAGYSELKDVEKDVASLKILLHAQVADTNAIQ